MAEGQQRSTRTSLWRLCLDGGWAVVAKLHGVSPPPIPINPPTQLPGAGGRGPGAGALTRVWADRAELCWEGGALSELPPLGSELVVAGVAAVSLL